MSASRVVDAVERIKRWMLAHDAPLLVENLADGASADVLDAAEARFGYRMPADLRALWSHHHGQRDELNGFIEFRDLLDVELALTERERVDAAHSWMEDADGDFAAAGLTDEERREKRWIPFASRDSDLLVLHATSGRVFVCEKDVPPLRLVAPSLTEWFEAYARRVEADDYAVEEGFGDYFLAQRDRAAEAAELEWERKRAEQERYRRETPLLEQLREALRDTKDQRAREVMEDLSKTPDLAEAVALLFTSTDARFIATALQYILRTVPLDAAQWRVVEDGGRALGNEAIVGIARERAATAPQAAKKPFWKLW